MENGGAKSGGRCDAVASARLVVTVHFACKRQMGLRSSLSRMAEEKTGREITKIGFDGISFLPSSCVACSFGSNLYLLR